MFYEIVMICNKWLLRKHKHFFLILTQGHISLLLERGREREKHRWEREIVIGCLREALELGITYAQIGDGTSNLDLFPDRESNLQTFGLSTTL